jgi:hypothetical protein
MTNNEGKTAMEIAEKLGEEDKVKLLKEALKQKKMEINVAKSLENKHGLPSDLISSFLNFGRRRRSNRSKRRRNRRSYRK